MKTLTDEQINVLLDIDHEGRRGLSRSVFDRDAVKVLMSLKAAGFVRTDNGRWHLTAGGFLLADACCGSLTFAAAFRRELARVFPGRRLEAVPPDHAVYRAFHALDSVELTPKAQATFGEVQRPYLEGISLEGSLRVLFSPLDLGNGWEGVPHPYARGYGPRSALRIGVNAIVYALSH